MNLSIFNQEKPKTRQPPTAELNQQYLNEFKKYDTNGDGHIDASEFKKILETLSQSSEVDLKIEHQITDKEVQLIFENSQFKDNQMSYDDFVDMITCVKETDDEIRQQFNFFDSNGDGKISKKELKKGLKKLKQDSSSKIVKEMMKNADVDGDGEVDFEEFKNILLGWWI